MVVATLVIKNSPVEVQKLKGEHNLRSIADVPLPE